MESPDMTRRLLWFSFAVVLAAPLAACRQGEGGVCQVHEDCEDGLVCVPSTQQCQQRGTTLIDAGGIDAAPLPADAAVDAAPADAMVDAMPPLD
jgi:hypothetical protein